MDDEKRTNYDVYLDQSTQLWTDILACLDATNLRTAYIHGPAGHGKTYAAQRVGLNGRDMQSVSLHEDTPSSDLRGHYLQRDGSFIWHDGPAVRAMRTGGRLVINEITRGSAEAISFFYPLLESLQTACLTLPTGETVRPASGFQVIVTDNEPPSMLPEALRDRCDIVLHANMLPPEALHTFPESWRAMIVDLARAHDGMPAVSLRQWEAVQRLSGQLGTERAMRCVMGAELAEVIVDAFRVSAAGDR